MDADAVSLVVGVVGGLAGLGGILTAWFSRRKIYAEAAKSGADSAQVLSAASIAMLQPMQSQITRLSNHLVESQARAETLDRKLRKTNNDLDVANRKLEIANQNIALMQKSVDDLSDQLGHYQDRYGPYPDPDGS